MEIQSALNSGVQGFQKAAEDANKAAVNIASETAVASENYSAAQEKDVKATNATAQNNGPEPTNLSQPVVDLRVAEFQAKGSAAVVEAADENLGTLLDVRV